MDANRILKHIIAALFYTAFGMLLTMLIVLFLFEVEEVAAVPACGPYAHLTSFLKTRHKEELVWRGIKGRSARGSRYLMELWTAEDGSWSFLQLDRRTGIACLVAGGVPGDKSDT